MRYKYYNKSNKSEVIAQVDTHDKVIGKVSRQKAHDRGILHREVGVWFLNKKGKILVQIRLDNRHFDNSAGGHFPYYESYRQAAIREVSEELGIEIRPGQLNKVCKDFVETKRIKYPHIRYLTIFRVQGNYETSQFRPNKDEVYSLEFHHPSNLLAMIEKEPGKFTNGFATLLQKVYGKS